MWNDLRFAFRNLRRAPGFTVLTVLTLAAGIGANTAIFSLLYQVVLRSIPVTHPESLVLLETDKYNFGWQRADNSRTFFSYPMYRELRDRNQVFTGLAGRAQFGATLAYRGNAASANAEVVTGNFFDVLGVKPALGRLLLPSDDDRGGAQPVVVLGYGYWAGHLGGDANVLNARVLMNGHPVTVVGVAARNFRSVVSGNDPDFYLPVSAVPLVSTGWTHSDEVDAAWLNLIGRLKPGVGAGQAGASLQPLYHAVMADQLPRFHRAQETTRRKLLAKTIRVEPASQGVNELRSRWQNPLIVLMVMVGLVLVIACANVANLLIARAAVRQREMSVRLAIGAGRMQIVRQLLTESFVVAIAGGLLGLVVANVLLAGLIRLLPENATGGWLSADLNARTLIFSIAVSVVTGIVFGLAPAVQALRPDVAKTLKEQSNQTGMGRGQSLSRRLLVIAQMCLSLLLLIGAGLFTRTLVNLLEQDPGFRTDHLVKFDIDPALSGYTAEGARVLFRNLEERLRAMPGVVAVSRAVFSPFSGMTWGSGIGLPGVKDGEQSKYTNENAVGADYFTTLGIPLVAGRVFTPAENGASKRVTILSEGLSKQLFGKENPIGRAVRLGPSDAGAEVVGVVRDSKYSDVRETPPNFAYVPFEQADARLATQAAFFLRTSGDESALPAAIRAAMRQLDPNVPVQQLNSYKVTIDESLYTDRLIATLGVAFGVLATLLAAVGLYGTISYGVTRRTQEFGVRLALGAARGDILGLVLREVGLLVLIGTAVGLPVSYVLARLVESQLFGVRAHDPVVLAGGALVVLVAALLAGILPSLRAMRIEPVRALRYE